MVSTKVKEKKKRPGDENNDLSPGDTSKKLKKALKNKNKDALKLTEANTDIDCTDKIPQELNTGSVTKKKKKTKSGKDSKDAETKDSATVTQGKRKRQKDASSDNPPKKSKPATIDDDATKAALTPEQMASKEKKREKMRLKKAAKKKQRDGQKTLASSDIGEPPGDEESAARVQALAYIQRWKNERHSWSFQKVRQVWLLKHMYDVKKVSDEIFPFLVEYLSGMKGLGRERTATDAQKILDEDEDEETDTEEKTDRARQIVQVLT